MCRRSREGKLERKTNYDYGKMSYDRNLLSGGSDPRDRQREITVPGLSRSGRSDESDYGLPVTCAASVTGERTIAGVPLTCSAGVSGPRTPARGCLRGEKPLSDREEKVGSFFPLRIVGGGGNGESSSEEDYSKPGFKTKGAGNQATTKTVEDRKKGKGRTKAQEQGCTTSKVLVRRSRSKIRRGMRTRSQRDAQQQQRRCSQSVDEPSLSSNNEERRDVSSGSSTDRYLPVMKPIKKEASQNSPAEKAQQPPPETVVVSDSMKKERSKVTDRGKVDKRNNTKMDSGPSSNEGEDSQRNGGGPGKSTYKKPRIVSNIPVNIALRRTGKRGRPPTTGEYSGLAEAKKAVNDEREREIRLERESRIMEMSEALQILNKAKLFPEETAEEAANTPTADIASQVREAQAEIVRISKISSNLKGDLQRSLRVSASLTMGMVDVLRTRADSTGAKTGEDELRRLRELVEKLNKAQEGFNEKLNAMKDELEKARNQTRREKEKREKALDEARREREKRERAMEKLRDERAKAEEAMASLRHMERLRASTMGRLSPPRPEPQLMETEEVFAPPQTQTLYSTAVTSPKGAKIRVTRRDLEEFPALRPPIQGKRMVIPDRDLPPPEVEREKRDDKISKRRKKKGDTVPIWDRMEAFSSTSMEIEDQPLPPLPQRPIVSRTPKEDKISTPRYRSEVLTTNRPPVQRGKDAEERRKERKKEKRRRKRQKDAARRQEEAHQRAGNPLEPRQKRGPKDTQTHAAADPGPASRTRARTRVTAEAATKVPRAQPPPPTQAATIKDVPVPPDGWTVVKDRRDRGADHNNRSQSRGRRQTYANAAAKPPAPPRKQPDTGRNAQRGRPTSTGRQRDATVRQQRQQQQLPTLKRPPKTAAIQVACPPGQAEITMRLARERVDIRRLGIEELRPRRARTGALLLEVPGVNGAAKADALAREMQEALKDREGVKISRPTRTAEIRIKDIEDSISAVEIANEVADSGECQVAEVRVGPIRSGTNRLGTAWVRCPLVAANRLMRKGHLKLGWTRARLELLQERPTTCYRCLQTGHVRAVCPNEVDRSNLCYRCGTAGHQAKDCGATPMCPLCAGTRRNANHRVGSHACKAPKRRERRSNGTADHPERISSNGPSNPRGPEPMDIAQDEAGPSQSPLSQSIGLITERGPEPIPIPPSQPFRPIMGRDQASPPPQPSQPDWPITGEGWSPDPQESGIILNKRRSLEVRLTRLETEVTPGTSQQTPPTPGQVVTLGWREVDCDTEEAEKEPVDADTRTLDQGGTNEEAPALEQETHNQASTGGGCTSADQ